MHFYFLLIKHSIYGWAVWNWRLAEIYRSPFKPRTPSNLQDSPAFSSPLKLPKPCNPLIPLQAHQKRSHASSIPQVPSSPHVPLPSQAPSITRTHTSSIPSSPQDPLPSHRPLKPPQHLKFLEPPSHQVPKTKAPKPRLKPQAISSPTSR